MMRFIFIFLAVTVNAVYAVDTLVDVFHAKYQGRTLRNGVNQWLSVRYAAPPLGERRFNAPEPPLNETEIQDATKEGNLCVAANKQPGLQYDNPRLMMDEDCLFMGIYSPANATVESKLPIMLFIQGGGFSSNSNGNFNGTGLVEASEMGMMVVRFNFRVGILGFIASKAVVDDKNGAQINNGLNDCVAALQWLKKHAATFGGDPDHIVLSGDSAGGNVIDLLITANNGTGFPDLFVGAMAESTSWGADGYLADREANYQKNVNSTGCSNDTDPLDCMRKLNITEFQNKTTSDGWGPTVDPSGRWMTAPHYLMMEQGLFQKIPVIYGTTSNEATPDYISNHSATTDDDLKKHILSSVGPSMTDLQAKTLLKMYPASLSNTSFYGRNVSESSSKNITLRRASGSGPQWQRDATIMSELKLNCVGMFFADMNAANNNTANWHYRYDVLDNAPGGLADKGLFTPHTSELYAIWGPNNTDGGDPKCFSIPASQTGCAEAIPILQKYWISFVKFLDPNKERLEGTPEWKTWSLLGAERLVFGNEKAEMEALGKGSVGMGQRERCVKGVLPFSKAINAGLRNGTSLLPFANGTRKDPTLDFVGKFAFGGQRV